MMLESKFYRCLIFLEKCFLLAVILFVAKWTSAQNDGGGQLFKAQYRSTPQDTSWIIVVQLVSENKKVEAKMQYDAISKKCLRKNNYHDYLFIANEYCYTLMEKQKDTLAIKILKNAVRKVQDRIDKDDIEFLIAHYYIARFYGLDIKAKYWYEDYFSLNSNYNSLDFLASLYFGGNLFINKNIDAAWDKWIFCIEHLNEADDIDIFYYTLAKLINKQDTDFSIYLLEYAIKINKSKSDSDPNFEFKCLKELCDIYVKRIDEKTAIKYGKAAVKLLEDFPNQVVENNAESNIYLGLAEPCIWNSDFELAQKCIAGYKSRKEIYVDSALVESFTDKILGEYYYCKEDFDSSALSFKKSLKSFEVVRGEFSVNKKLPLGYLAYIEWMNGNYNAAIDYYKDVMKIFCSPEYNSMADTFKFVSPSNLKNVRGLSTAVYSVLDILQIYSEWYEQEPSDAILYEIIKFSNYNMDIIMEWFKNSISNKSLLAASSLLKKNSAFAVNASYILSKNNENYIDSILMYADAARLFNFSYLKKLKQQDVVNYNDTLINKLSKLSLELASINPAELKNNYKYLRKKLELLQLKMSLNEVNPERFESIVFDKEPSHIKENLDDETALISYFIVKETVYISGCTSDKSFVKKIEFTDLNKNINKLRRNLKGGDLNTEEEKLFYRNFIRPVLNELSKVKKLVIIPDEKLIGIPFEVFRDEHNKQLINNFSFKYLYSTKNFNVESESSEKRLLAFAPGFIDNSAFVKSNVSRSLIDSCPVFDRHDRDLFLAPIQASIDEVKEIDALFSRNGSATKIVVGIDATEQSFKELAKDNTIIHLATHGVSGNTYESGVFFSLNDSSINDGFLRLSELYNLNINADIVVLSACKTAAGNIIEGEGVMAISRGFIFAGAKNIIASLWKVHDEKTKDLMVAFYTHLLEDKVSYAEALRLTKLDCIAKGFLPIDWAGFVLIGN